MDKKEYKKLREKFKGKLVDEVLADLGEEKFKEFLEFGADEERKKNSK